MATRMPVIVSVKAVEKSTTTSSPEPEDCDPQDKDLMEKFRLATIVLGAVLGVFLLILLIFIVCLCLKRCCYCCGRGGSGQVGISGGGKLTTQNSGVSMDGAKFMSFKDTTYLTLQDNYIHNDSSSSNDTMPQYGGGGGSSRQEDSDSTV